MRSLAPDSHRGTQRQRYGIHIFKHQSIFVPLTLECGILIVYFFSTTNRSNVSNHYAVSNYFVPPPTISQQHKQKTLLR